MERERGKIVWQENLGCCEAVVAVPAGDKKLFACELRGAPLSALVSI
jgi:hypothetical protein